MKIISIVTPCYNEEKNIEALYHAVKNELSNFPQYEYEHIFIDNASTDKTVQILKCIAQNDKRLKIIINTRNFGHIRSPFYAMLQAKGDAVIMMAADFQDPPSLIPEFISKWEQGYQIVIGVREKSQEFFFMSWIRNLFYLIIKKISEDVPQIPNYHGFGLYSRKVVDILKSIPDPNPYFRGLICEIGFEHFVVKYNREKRKSGKSKNNLYTLYDIAMLGIINYSKLPLRVSVFIGFIIAIISLAVSLFYLIYKLVFWERFIVGNAPIVIGLFFLGAVQLISIGIIGEYVGAIFTFVKQRPLVIEKERINFD
jgi:glycosyltransferase involved in cell wall biosynthesis